MVFTLLANEVSPVGRNLLQEERIHCALMLLDVADWLSRGATPDTPDAYWSMNQHMNVGTRFKPLAYGCTAGWWKQVKWNDWDPIAVGVRSTGTNPDFWVSFSSSQELLLSHDLRLKDYWEPTPLLKTGYSKDNVWIRMLPEGL